MNTLRKSFFIIGGLLSLIISSLHANAFYDPFGNILSLSGPLAEANLYRFSSKEYHPNSAVVYYLYRFYEPSSQRWPNRDLMGEPGFETLRRLPAFPFAGDVNRYTFAENNPNTFIDPYGLVDTGTVIVGGLGAYGMMCNILIKIRIDRFVKTLNNDECGTWLPKCLNLVALLTGAPGPLGIRACKDCNGKVTVDVIFVDLSGAFGGGPPPEA